MSGAELVPALPDALAVLALLAAVAVGCIGAELLLRATDRSDDR